MVFSEAYNDHDIKYLLAICMHQLGRSDMGIPREVGVRSVPSLQVHSKHKRVFQSFSCLNTMSCIWHGITLTSASSLAPSPELLVSVGIPSWAMRARGPLMYDWHHVCGGLGCVEFDCSRPLLLAKGGTSCETDDFAPVIVCA